MTEQTSTAPAAATSASTRLPLRFGPSAVEVQRKPDGTIVDANQKYAAMVGWSLDQLKGRHHSVVMHAAERESDPIECCGTISAPCWPPSKAVRRSAGA